MAGLRKWLALALVPGLLWAAGGFATAAAEEPDGPTVVVEAPADPEVRAAVTFPHGWRLEAAQSASRRQVHPTPEDRYRSLAESLVWLPDED